MYWDTPFFRTEKGTFKTVATKMETIHIFKNCISISVATVLEMSKMTESHMYKSLVFGDFGSRAAFKVTPEVSADQPSYL